MVRFHSEFLRLVNLKVEAHIGVDSEEREQPQPLWITITIPADLSRAAQTDSIDHTLDYALVAQETRRFMEGRTFHLVEALGRTLGGHLAEKFDLAALSLEIKKPMAVADCDGPVVALSVSREKTNQGTPP
ncbi:MAG: dihydroneopterin aldolase [Deltaproteobacteria bacterium]|nr:dihydroneopterin aldolase [Deltaproteobacteria bacterium]